MLVDGEHDGGRARAPAQMVHQVSDAQKPSQAETFNERARGRKAESSRRCGAEKNERRKADLGDAPRKATPTYIARRRLPARLLLRLNGDRGSDRG
jgi:hypothetical protein